MLEAELPCLRTRQAGPLPWLSTLHFGMPSLSSPPLSGNTQYHQQEPRQDLLAPVPISTFGDIIQLSNPLSPPPTHMRNGPCGPRSSGIMPMYQSQAPWAGLILRGWPGRWIFPAVPKDISFMCSHSIGLPEWH